MTGTVPDVVQHDATTAAEVLTYDHVVLSRANAPGRSRGLRGRRRRPARRHRPGPRGCLGMQGLVTTYGGAVERIEPAHGDVAAACHVVTGIFAGTPSPYSAVRYHSLAATRVPAELVVTAERRDAERGSVVMGARHRHVPLHDVQLHPESVLSEHGVRLVENFLLSAR